MNCKILGVSGMSRKQLIIDERFEDILISRFYVLPTEITSNKKLDECNTFINFSIYKFDTPDLSSHTEQGKNPVRYLHKVKEERRIPSAANKT